MIFFGFEIAEKRWLQMATALLDDATPLICAALRGNPAQVDHLLYCGADPCATNAAGDLALEMVPLCGDRSPSGARICRCMCASDEQVWECRSRVTRQMIMQVRNVSTVFVLADTSVRSFRSSF